jgi:hypothetical protein
VIHRVAGRVEETEVERANRDRVAVVQPQIHMRRNIRVRRDRRLGQRHRLLVAVDVIRVPVGVDDVRDLHPLLARTLHERLGGVRRIDHDRLLRLPIAQQVAEIPVAAGPDLFEHQLHG